MKISVLMSSYNYKDFIVETIDSVLAQTRKADEIIIVDDGSSDGTVDFILNKYQHEDSIKIIAKENGGQLSALNEAYRIATGEIICFADSDDQYESTYLETLEDIYGKNSGIQYISCAYNEFGKRTRTVSKYKDDCDLGITPVGVYFGSVWTSGPTVTVSARKYILDKYFPIPFEREWVISPDACITLGASMVGARKYFLSKPLVRYRIHDKNAHVTAQQGKHIKYEYLFKKYQFMNYVLTNNFINIDHLVDTIIDEFRSISSQDVKKTSILKYLKIVALSKSSFVRKLFLGFKLVTTLIGRG